MRETYWLEPTVANEANHRSIASFEVISWALWTLLALLGFAVAVKRSTERITLRIVRHRKARRERLLAMSQAPAAVGMERKAA